MQAIYDEGRSRALGNEPVVRALRELAKYEQALAADLDKDTEGDTIVNHRVRWRGVCSGRRACRCFQAGETTGLNDP